MSIDKFSAMSLTKTFTKAHQTQEVSGITKVTNHDQANSKYNMSNMKHENALKTMKLP